METFPLFALAAIAIGVVGPVVRNLHLLLIKLDVGEVPEDEASTQTYGLRSAELVAALQHRLGLQPPRRGEVDEASARVINEHAFELGLFQLVMGTVVDVQGAPAAGVTVRIHDADNLDGLACAEVQTLADGTYRAFYHPGFYRMERPGVAQQKEMVDVVVRVLDATGAEMARSAVFVDPDPSLQVDLQISAEPEPEAEWIARGQVVDAGGPVNGVTVSVYDRDLFFRRDASMTGQHLGTDTTKDRDGGKTGWFELHYASADFDVGDIPTNGTLIPDLIFDLSRDGRALEKFQIFRLPDGKDLGEEIPVSDDDLIMGLQARRIEEVRIVIEGGAPKPQLSEYEQLILALAPLLPEQAPANVDAAQREALVGAMLLRFDEENHRDISFAARETRLERFLIEKLVAAFKLARDPFEDGVPASVFYGLARAGIGSDVLALARASTEALRLALKKASTGTPLIIMPFSPESRLEESVQAIRDQLALSLPNYRPAEGAPSLSDLVGADLPDAAEQATLWRTFSDHVGTAGEFWEKLATLPGFGDPKKVAKVKYGFQLGALTQNNIGLISAIRTKHSELSSTGELAFELDTPGKWEALFDSSEVAIPDDVPGEPEERKANYAASLASAVQIAHPTTALANLVAALPPTEFSSTQPAVAQFLSDAVRKAQFDLVEGRIHELLAEHGDDLLKDIQAEERPMVVAQIKRLQRLFRLSAGPQSVKALLEAGFNSAREIAELPPEVALDILTPSIGEAEARLVINRANNISAAAIHQYVLLNDVINNDIPGGAL